MEVQIARTPIQPGETLREDLEALGMSAAELSRQIQVPVNRITQILNGVRSITGDTALRLGHFFANSTEFLLNLQKLHDLRVAQLSMGEKLALLPKFDPLDWEKRHKIQNSTALHA